MKHATLQHYRDHVDRRLLRRLVLYIVISVVMVILFAYQVVADRVGLGYPLIALALGFGIGWLMSFSRSVSWDAGARKVVSRVDVFGVVIIILYIVSGYLREQIVDYFVHGPSILATTFALAAGLMFGRIWGIHGKVSAVIGENM